MQLVNNFSSAGGTVFAVPGEFFGVIDLPDYLVMDEVAGHLINRSVMSVIVRLKMENSHSKRVYECNIKSKASQSVIVKLNEKLCKDYAFANDQVIQIDLKFKYNRRPMCEMHEAIDMCRKKTEILLPNVKNASYKSMVSNGSSSTSIEIGYANVSAEFVITSGKICTSFIDWILPHA